MVRRFGVGARRERRLRLEGLEQRSLLSAGGLGLPVSEGVSQISLQLPYNRSDWYEPQISDDGRYVAFSAPARLVPEDTNDVDDVYLLDLQTSELTWVSKPQDGSQPDDGSWKPEISPDGRYVAFMSRANNLLAEDQDPSIDLFVYDRVTAIRECITSAQDGDALAARFSGNNEKIVYEFEFDDNSPSAPNAPTKDIVLYDRTTGERRVVTKSYDGGAANNISWRPHISHDGGYVVFQSMSSNLVPNDLNLAWDVFVYDVAADTLECLSVNPDGDPANGESQSVRISGDGRFVTFQSSATDLTAASADGIENVYLLDRATGEQTAVAGDGFPDGAAAALRPDISTDGRYIVYHGSSSATDETKPDTIADIYVYDRVTGETWCVSRQPNGLPSGATNAYPSISGDAGWVAFLSDATNLTAGSAPDSMDLFVMVNPIAEQLPMSAISLEVTVNGYDADEPPGPTISVRESYGAELEYSVNPSASLVVDDPMDDDGTWTLIDGSFPHGLERLAPSAGDSFWGSTFDQPVTVGLEKEFSGTKISAGRYVVQVDTSAVYSGEYYDIVEFDEFTEIGLSGIETPRAVASAPAPPGATPTWTAWSFRYDVSEDSPDVGKPLMFRALLTVDIPYSVMLDHVRIYYQPSDQIDWLYEVTNPGILPLSNVVVVDDHGTPDDSRDDYSPWFVGGDINGDGMFDPGETWLFSATATPSAGSFKSQATVTATDSLQQEVSDSDSSFFVAIVTEIDLGTVDFLQLPSQTTENGVPAYHLTATRDGVLTIDATFDSAGGDVTLRLFDDAGNLIDQTTGNSGYLRMDHRDALGGTGYLLQVLGSNPSVDLRICNMVSQTAEGVEVFDADGDDAFAFAVADGFDVTVNGLKYHFDQGSRFTFRSNDGDDALELTDSDGDDQLKITPSQVTMTGLPVAGRLYTFTAKGFGDVQAYARAGGNDTAVMSTSEAGRVKVYPDSVKLMGADFNGRVKFFESTTVEMLSTKDSGVVSASTGVDALWAMKGKARIAYDIGASTAAPAFDDLAYDVTILGCERLAAQASGGDDWVELHDSVLNDVLIAKPHKTEMMNGPRAAEGIERGDEYEIGARGFRNVLAIADQGGAGDAAKLYDSGELGVDVWAAAYSNGKTWSTMSSPSRRLYEVWGFEQVGGYGLNGGLGANHGTNRKDHAADTDFVFQYGYWENPRDPRG